MGKTLRTYKGKDFPQSKEKKKIEGKKFFGYTSGSHSRGLHKRISENGHVVYIKTDETPIKGKHFIKYGWPFDLRNKKIREF